MRSTQRGLVIVALQVLDEAEGGGGEGHYAFGSSSGAALALQGVTRGLPITKLLMYEAPFVDTPAGGRYFMCDVVGMPKLMGYAFALFPMWPKLKQAANALPYDLTIMADTEILGARSQAVRIPVLVGGGAKSPEALKGAVRKSPAPSRPRPPNGSRGRPTTSAPSRPPR